MSGERAAVAEVLAGHVPVIQGSGGFFTCSCKDWGYGDPRHEGTYPQHLAAALATATPARLSEAERDLLAESLRHQWEGGRHRFMTWGDLSERDKDRWREEADILPIAELLTARAVQPTPPDLAAEQERYGTREAALSAYKRKGQPTPPVQAEAVVAAERGSGCQSGCVLARGVREDPEFDMTTDV